MAIDLLIVAVGFALGIVIALLLGYDFGRKSKHYSKPPNPIKPWKGKHPTGEVTFVVYRRVNESGKLVWKFKGYNEEVAAEIPYDVQVELGAEAGEPGRYFCFRVNPDGSQVPWTDPAIESYFERQSEARRIFYEVRRKQKQLREYQAKSETSLDRKIEDGIAEDYVSSQFGQDKALAEYILNKRGVKVNTAKKEGEEEVKSDAEGTESKQD